MKHTKEEVKNLKARLGITGTRKSFVTIKDLLNKWHVHISTLTGKLTGFQSISSSIFRNPLCELRRKIKGSICEVCFSCKQQENGKYKPMKKNLIENSEVLSKTLIPVEEWPLLNALFFRIESHGDVATVTQARNYIHFTLKNPSVTFGWWTKNPAIIHEALIAEGYNANNGEKPSNIIFLFSSVMRNKEVEISAIRKIFPWIDKTFTCFDIDYILDNPSIEQKINCGSRKCLECRICYTHNDIEKVYEVVK